MHEWIASALDLSGMLAVTLRMRRSLPISTITIVTYHRIANPCDEPYDPDVVDATPDQFLRQMTALARAGTPIGIEALIRGLEGHPLPPNPIMITFDDGYRSCRDVALPILRELGIPATFFIATRFASTRELYWWEQIAAVLHAARGRSGLLAYPYPLWINTNNPHTHHTLASLVKNTYGLDLGRFLAELRTTLNVPWSAELEAALAAPLIMGWDDIRALASAGMDIESHTRHHRVLDTLDAADLREELLGSRADLEAELGRPVRAFAYPVGRCPSARIRRAVDEAGYRIAFSNASGINYLWPAVTPVHPLAIRRVATERTYSDAMFLAQVLIPGFAYAKH
jgi:peptidoglycan/xylan/chitin deacetylase (PgdA/CDA1 family)